LYNLNDKSDGAACLGAGVSAFQHGPAQWQPHVRTYPLQRSGVFRWS